MVAHRVPRCLLNARVCMHQCSCAAERAPCVCNSMRLRALLMADARRPHRSKIRATSVRRSSAVRTRVLIASSASRACKRFEHRPGRRSFACALRSNGREAPDGPACRGALGRSAASALPAAGKRCGRADAFLSASSSRRFAVAHAASKSAGQSLPSRLGASAMLQTVSKTSTVLKRGALAPHREASARSASVRGRRRTSLEHGTLQYS
jgi:hypothetical protein